MRGIVTAVVVIALMMTAPAVPPVAAQTQQQIDWCFNAKRAYSPGLRISGCTAVIQSARVAGREPAVAYISRGDAYNTQGNYDQAIADYSEAIRLDPKSENAYFHRGSAYRAKHDYSPPSPTTVRRSG
jgi:tetratricopeptide (TPR) repeat protein